MTIYYDSCIFGNSLNPAHPLHASCEAAVTGSDISWSVALSTEISVSEMPSIGLAIDAFFIHCALAGVSIIDVTLAASKIAAKPHRKFKKPLEQLGFMGSDWNHLLAAVSAASERIWTTDEDFFDPSNKSVRGTAKHGNKVASYIKSKFAINVELPP